MHACTYVMCLYAFTHVNRFMAGDWWYGWEVGRSKEMGRGVRMLWMFREP